ncbi:MAG: cupin domain-containing protein [Pirellulaceae bacterium]
MFETLAAHSPGPGSQDRERNKGTGEAILDGVRTAIRAGFAVVVPAGTNHNIINTGSASLKVYTIYSPPNHRDGVVHHTRADAEADNEHFDGRTTE